MLERIRHRHGFGVHSTLAYRLIREAICAPRGYLYYEEELLDNTEMPECARRELKRIVRLKNHPMLKESKWRYFSHPSEERVSETREILERDGGLMILGRDFMLAVKHEMAFICYRV